MILGDIYARARASVGERAQHVCVYARVGEKDMQSVKGGERRKRKRIK